MMSITGPMLRPRGAPTLMLQRAYLLVVLSFTAWVGSFGFFWPLEIQRALPWPVPPLHARIIGAVYLSATVFLLLSMLAGSRLRVRTILDIAFVWTAWLLLVSILHWDSFDPSRVQVRFWVIAYVSFPVGAWYLNRVGPAPSIPAHALIRQRWVIEGLRMQGTALVVLAALLAILPGWMAGIWPWKISTFLAQLYSGPVLGYGVGSLLLAARRNWPELLLPSLGMFVFASLAAAGSAWHIGLFAHGSVSQISWFGALGLLACLSLVLMGGALRNAGKPALGEQPLRQLT